MARRRPRAIVANDRYRVNGHTLEGAEVTILGRCSLFGKQKNDKGKALPKKALTHNLAKWSDKKLYRTLGTRPEPFIISDWSLKTFFEMVPDA